jgi:hypothetical protein
MSALAASNVVLKGHKGSFKKIIFYIRMDTFSFSYYHLCMFYSDYCLQYAAIHLQGIVFRDVLVIESPDGRHAMENIWFWRC